jgi:hypothetical protein
MRIERVPGVGSCNVEFSESPELAIGRIMAKKGIKLCKEDLMCNLKLQ